MHFLIFVWMLKKFLIVSFLLSAYTIVLAHSIIPHCHHDDHETGQTSDYHDHDDDDHDDNAGLAHDFENYIHSGTTTEFHQQPDTKISCKTFTSIYFLFLFEFPIKPVESPPLVVRQAYDHIPLLQHSLSTKGLRAPPII
jgi:hypothetical protein